MASARSTIAAILTGDLVGSTEPRPQLRPRDGHLAEAARAAAADRGLGRALHPLPRGRMAGSRGGFTLLFRTAPLFLVATLRASDAGLATRIASRIGGVDGLGTDTLADMPGGLRDLGPGARSYAAPAASPWTGTA